MYHRFSPFSFIQKEDVYCSVMQSRCASRGHRRSKARPTTCEPRVLGLISQSQATDPWSSDCSVRSKVFTSKVAARSCAVAKTRYLGPKASLTEVVTGFPLLS